ncbi:uncharacterized protein DS421_15g498550 [Arachis hypogaea]|nr:uncharacterized protein DS421_15g498550 [Arachis hypogaea]
MVDGDGDRGRRRGRGRGRGRGRRRKGRPRLSTGHPLDLHADPYSLIGSSSDTTAPTNGRLPPIATTTPSCQEPQIHMMPTPGVPRSCTQQANEPSNTASHGVQSDPAIGAPSRAGSCGERQTTSNSTQDAQGQGTSTATGHSSTSDPKLRYDGAKCWHPPKPGLKRISQVFKENYNKPWLSFDEADDDTRKIWWTEWRKCFDIIDTEEDDIYQAGGLGLPSACEVKNTAARKSTRGTSLHTAGGTTFLEARLHLNHSLGRPSRMDEFFKHTHTRKEDRTQWVDEHSRKTKDIFQERMFQVEQERHAAIEAGVIDPPPVSEESIWIETVVRPRVDGPTTTTSIDVLDLRERITILNREVEQHAAKYRELEDHYQREKREWQQTVESLCEDLNTSNSQMDQFSHQLSSLTEYVRAIGPSSSGSRVPPPPPFTFPNSQKSTAPTPVPTPAPGRKLPPILQRPGQPQNSQKEDDSDDFDDSDDYLDEYE